MKLFEELESRDLLTAYLPQDLDNTPAGDIRQSTRLGEFTYFSANTLDRGHALWLTDGTASNTRIVGELVEKTGEYVPRPVMKILGDRLLVFDGNDTSTTIWSTKGSTLSKVATIEDARVNRTAVEYNNGIVFVSVQNQPNLPVSNVMWTDGRDVVVLSPAWQENIEQLLVLDGELVIDSREGLWAFDAENTRQLIEPRDHYVDDFVRDDRLFSVDRQAGEITVRDEIDSVPVQLADFDGFENVNRLRDPFTLRRDDTTSRDFFVAARKSGVSELWWSDGTVENTRQVTEFANERIHGVERIGEHTYVVAQSMDGLGSTIYELDEADGVLTTLKTIPEFATIFFDSSGDDEDVYVMGYDGTASNPRAFVLDNGDVSHEVELNRGEFIFDISENSVIVPRSGDAPNTQELVSIELSSKEESVIETFSVPTRSARPRSIVPDDDRVHFRASLPDDAWTFDGQQFEEAEIRNVISAHQFGQRSVWIAQNLDETYAIESYSVWIEETPDNEPKEVLTFDGTFGDLIDVDQLGDQLFVSFDGDIWIIDSDLESKLLSERVPELAWDSLFPGHVDLVAHDGALYFIRNDLDGIWRTDGTAKGTYLAVKQDARMSQLVRGGNELYFVGDRNGIFGVDETADFGSQFSRPLVALAENNPQLIGTDFGLFYVERLENGSVLMNSDREVLADFDERLFEVKWEATNDRLILHYFDSPQQPDTDRMLHVWVTDGTVFGTNQLVRKSSSYSQSPVAVSNGMIYVSVIKEDRSGKLWAMDGTNRAAYVYDFLVAPTELTPYQGGIVFSGGSEQFGSELWVLPDPRPVPGDIDGNGKVGFEDFTFLSSEFGQKRDGLASDIDGDGDVDFQDFLKFTSNFAREKPETPNSALEVMEPRRVDLALLAIID